MVNQQEQEFLNTLEKKLWTSANKLLPSLDASQYKHVMLGLIFIKYVSDAFDLRREELKAQLQNPEQDYYLDPADFGGAEAQEYTDEINAELEVRDYYLETNTFWVPTQARWQFLQDNNKTVIGGAEVPLAASDGKAKTLKISSVGHLIDNALEAIETDNPKLKGVLNKRYTQLQIDQAKLGELIDLVATVPFTHASLNSKDILGHVYEYMLGQFALAEGKKAASSTRLNLLLALSYKCSNPSKVAYTTPPWALVVSLCNPKTLSPPTKVKLVMSASTAKKPTTPPGNWPP